MSAELDLDDVAATSKLAQAELAHLRARNAELVKALERIIVILNDPDADHFTANAFERDVTELLKGESHGN